jgi:hypothetical protein
VTKPQILIFSVLLCACATNKATTTTDSKAKSKSKTQDQPVEIAVSSDDEVVEEVAIAVMEEPQPIRSSNPRSFDAVKNIQFNQKYGISSNINDQYDLSWEKNASNRNDRQGVVDKNGNVILPHIFTKKYGGPSTNYELLLGIGNTTGLYNLIENRWTIPLMYDELTLLSNNQLYVAKKEGKWGVIDKNNVVIVPFEWSQVQQIYNLENYVSVTKDQLQGVFSIVEKKLTIPCIYSSVRKLDRQNSFLVKQSSGVNIVDISNIPIFKNWYEDIRTTSSDNYIVKQNSRFGIVDNNEKIVVPIEYMEFGEYPYSDGSYLARNKEGKFGFILIDGRVTLPFKYDNVRKGSSNIVSIQGEKCGLVQVNSGAPIEIVTCEFDNIIEGSKTFIVEKDGKFGLLNQYGKQMIATEYESLQSFKEGYYDNATVYIAKKGKNYFLINEQGRVISESDITEITPLYRKSQASYYSQKFTYMKVKAKNGKFGIMDKVGKMIVAPQFDDVVSEDDNLMVVRSKGKCGMYSLLGQKQILPFEYDLITRANDSFIGITGNDIDFLNISSDQVTKIDTVAK